MRALKISRSHTPRSENSFNIYLNEIGDTKPLSISEEVDCAYRWRVMRDEAARTKLLAHNRAFVVSVAKQYQGQTKLSLSDLVQAGNLGLITAADRFDETKGFKFISFAVWWIRQAIQHFLYTQSDMVRLPSNIVSQKVLINRKIDEFAKNGDTISFNDAAKELGLKNQYLKSALVFNQMYSIDVPVADTDNTFAELIPSEDLQYEIDRKALLTKAMKKILSEKEILIITSFYGFEGYEQTIDQIAHRLGLSRERVRQIMENAVKKLKKNSALFEEIR